MGTARITEFTEALMQSLTSDGFIKLALGHYHGSEAGLQKILARKIVVKKIEHLSFTYRYKTRDIVKNYTFNESAERIAEHLHSDFKRATLFTRDFDMQFDGTKPPAKITRTAPTQKEPASLSHDRPKNRAIQGNRPYLHALGITNAVGTVIPASQDKFRQINKYIEILGGLIAKLPKRQPLRIADMGAGKGYLTFALYDHLQSTHDTPPAITGVEYRKDLVDLCNRIATESAFSGLRFIQGSIEQFDSTGTDVLIALHACDTATDDAIAKGIHAKAALIVVAPCCHKQIRQQMDASPPAPSMEFLLKHGTLMERQAEMVTDGLRGLLLELHGYRTNLFEFISDAHTPKNIMITAVRTTLPEAARRTQLLREITRAKEQFGIKQHYLETLLA